MINNYLQKKKSHIQLPYGLVRKSKKIKLKTHKNYGASQYIARLPYLHNGYDPKFQNDAIDSRADLRKFWLATSDYGKISKKIITRW